MVYHKTLRSLRIITITMGSS